MIQTTHRFKPRFQEVKTTEIFEVIMAVPSGQSAKRFQSCNLWMDGWRLHAVTIPIIHIAAVTKKMRLCVHVFFQKTCKFLPFNHIHPYYSTSFNFRMYWTIFCKQTCQPFLSASSDALAKKQLQKHSAKMKATKPAELMTLVK